MALTTYANLQTAMTSWLARDDLTSYYPDFITLFEAEAARRLRIRVTETSATLTPSAGSATLPTDYMGWRRVTYNGDTLVELEYVHPSFLPALYPTTASGTPAVFTIEGTTFKVRPTSTTTVTLDYFAKPAALSGTVNSVYSNHPDLYLAGSLFEAYMFDKDINNAAQWKSRRDEIFDSIKTDNFRNPGALTIRPMTNTP